VEVLSNFTNRRQITYALLSDPQSQIIDLYGLRDPQYPPGNRAHGVPRPTMFILDRQGTIKAKLFEESYTKRPPIALILEALDKLPATGG
jgi:peroxiredoxin